MKKLNVLHLVTCIQFGGISTLLLDIVAEDNDNHHTVISISQPNNEVLERFKKRGIEVYCLDYSGKSNFYSSMIKLKSFIKHNNINILNSHTVLAWFFVILSCAFSSLKLIHTFHGLNTKSKNTISDRIMFQLALMRTDSFIAVSCDVAKVMMSRFSISYDRMNIIHNGLSTERVSDLLSYSSNKDYPERKKFSIVSVGRLRPEKGHVILIGSIKKLIDRGYDVTLTIVGGGDMHDVLNSLIESMSLSNKIRVLGYRNDVYDLLSKSDIFVLPSRREPFGIAILEAMVLGLPVVAFKSGGVPEIISHGVNGVLVNVQDETNLADGISILIEDYELRSNLVLCGKDTVVNDFSISKTIDSLCSTYRSVYN